MALSLLEANKLLPQDAVRSFVQLYAQGNPLLSILPIENTSTGNVRVTRQATLATAGTRGINADFATTSGSYSTYDLSTKIYGGVVKIDRKFAIENPNSLKQEKAGQIASFSKTFYTDFFDGDNNTEIYGLKNQIGVEYPTQNISMGASGATSATGLVITMAKMDELLDAVNILDNNTFIFMNQRPFNALNTLARTNGSGQQNIQYVVNDFGMRIPYYNNCRVIVTRDGAGNDIIATDEMASTVSGGSGTSTSVYAVSFGPESVTGFQSAQPYVGKEPDNSNFETWRIEWLVGLAMKNPRAAARLYGVKNAIS